MKDDVFELFGGEELKEPVFKLGRSSAEFSYYDFASNREAFARGQKDARPYIEGGCFYRLRGRTKLSYTLLSFNDPQEAWDQIKAKKLAGIPVRGVAWTTPCPEGIPTKKSDVEFWVTDIDDMVKKNGKPVTKLRNAWVEGLELRPPTREEAAVVFDAWVKWADSRHFMVFKGHYKEWLRRHFDQESPGTRLTGFFMKGSPVGIFGTETVGDVGVVVVAKHMPELKPNVLWVRGLQDTGTHRILCGSTADTFKSRLGMLSERSWAFDLSGVVSQEKDAEDE